MANYVELMQEVERDLTFVELRVVLALVDVMGLVQCTLVILTCLMSRICLHDVYAVCVVDVLFATAHLPMMSESCELFAADVDSALFVFLFVPSSLLQLIAALGAAVR